MLAHLRSLAIALLIASASSAADNKPFDPAAAFGAREDVLDMTLSPDGKSVAYISPAVGPGSVLMTQDLADGSKAHITLVANGKPEQFDRCHWVSNERLVCTIIGIVPSPVLISGGGGLIEVTRVVAVDRSGGNMRVLSSGTNEYSHAIENNGGEVVDWMPDQDGMVLMSRYYHSDERTGSYMGNKLEGLGVDLLDTRNLSAKTVEEPGNSTEWYLSDGRGAIRIVAKRLKTRTDLSDSGIMGYSYRKQGSREWNPLGESNFIEKTGIEPLAVDHDLNVVYVLKKKDGRRALFSIALDGTMDEKLVFEGPDVDVTGLFQMGRRDRVVGVTYWTDYRQVEYFDPDIAKLMSSLAHALPNHPVLHLVESSMDEQVLLFLATSDDDPGVYYVFDRQSKQLHTFLVARSRLEGVKLAKVKPVHFPAADGTLIPGYLTLPPGKEDAKGLPAIVLPHGGPSERDYGGFDWLPQYFSNIGYAVLQPNYRGSAGYGDAWMHVNAFKSWRLAIGDVLDAGHWLVAQGIADPGRIAIVGWSYGGYAALQSAVTEPGFFKAVVAIAPVTDLEASKEEWRYWSNYHTVREEIGEGPYVREGSPAKNADKIKVPVLLFHGGHDRNVRITQSHLMADQLTKAHVKNELVTWDYLDHHLEDSDARTQMLRKSDEFLRQSMGGGK
jgi:dipeptidyl aminopeptidase/acylaminoacyl peptidase